MNIFVLRYSFKLSAQKWEQKESVCEKHDFILKHFSQVNILPIGWRFVNQSQTAFHTPPSDSGSVAIVACTVIADLQPILKCRLWHQPLRLVPCRLLRSLVFRGCWTPHSADLAGIVCIRSPSPRSLGPWSCIAGQPQTRVGSSSPLDVCDCDWDTHCYYHVYCN